MKLCRVVTCGIGSAIIGGFSYKITKDIENDVNIEPIKWKEYLNPGAYFGLVIGLLGGYGAKPIYQFCSKAILDRSSAL